MCVVVEWCDRGWELSDRGVVGACDPDECYLCLVDVDGAGAVADFGGGVGGHGGLEVVFKGDLGFGHDGRKGFAGSVPGERDADFGGAIKV